jgi:argininosuccinate lyase
MDFQEITPLLWRSVDTLKACLEILIQLVPELKLRNSIADRHYVQFIAATEVANAIVSVGSLPFRAAHRAVGEAVRQALKQGKTLRQLTSEDWKQVMGKAPDRRTLVAIGEMLDLSKQVQNYRTQGSPNPRHTRHMIEAREKQVRRSIRSNVVDELRLKKALVKLHELGSGT